MCWISAVNTRTFFIFGSIIGYCKCTRKISLGSTLVVVEAAATAMAGQQREGTSHSDCLFVVWVLLVFYIILIGYISLT